MTGVPELPHHTSVKDLRKQFEHVGHMRGRKKKTKPKEREINVKPLFQGSGNEAVKSRDYGTRKNPKQDQELENLRSLGYHVQDRVQEIETRPHPKVEKVESDGNTNGEQPPSSSLKKIPIVEDMSLYGRRTKGDKPPDPNCEVVCERPDSDENPSELGNWYLKVNDRFSCESECKAKFNDDFRCSFKNFHELWHLGGEYIAPPFPHNQTSENDKAHALDKYYQKWMVETMLKSDVGRGTDPERKEHDLLNVKAPVLSRALFPTLTLEDNLHQPFQKIHTLLQDKYISNNNKISFGVGVHFPQVSLGFTSISEFSKSIRSLDMIGITDEGYKWATTSNHLMRDRLHRHLDLDCRKAVTKLVKEWTSWFTYFSGKDTKFFTQELEDYPDADFKDPRIQLPFLLTIFMEKYGTHVVLKCSHGYRKLQVDKTTLRNQKSFNKFKQKLDSNFMETPTVASIKSKKRKGSESNDNTHSDDTFYIGSPKSLKNALKKENKFGAWVENVASKGDANVISHDETIMLADILEHGSTSHPYANAGNTGNITWNYLSRIYRFWTNVRIRDLQQG